MMDIHPVFLHATIDSNNILYSVLLMLGHWSTITKQNLLFAIGGEHFSRY
jgi:hypothetical protein